MGRPVVRQTFTPHIIGTTTHWNLRLRARPPRTRASGPAVRNSTCTRRTHTCPRLWPSPRQRQQPRPARPPAQTPVLAYALTVPDSQLPPIPSFPTTFPITRVSIPRPDQSRRHSNDLSFFDYRRNSGEHRDDGGDGGRPVLPPLEPRIANQGSEEGTKAETHGLDERKRQSLLFSCKAQKSRRIYHLLVGISAKTAARQRVLSTIHQVD